VDGRVAHRAGLLFLREVVCRPNRPLGRRGVALQAQQASLADSQQAGISCPMGRVATGTALSLQRQVLKHEGALLVRVAPDTDGIAGRDLAYTPQSASAVKAMTIRALDETLVRAVVVGLSKICFGGGVTPVTELWLSLGQESLDLLCVVRGVAVETANIIARMRGATEVRLAVAVAVTAQAAGARLLPREILDE
jgi:hypothetical protein